MKGKQWLVPLLWVVSSHGLAQTPESERLKHICYGDVPSLRPEFAPIISDDLDAPVKVRSNISQVNRIKETAIFRGGVEVTRGSQQFYADQIEYNRKTGEFFAPGDFFYRDSQLEFLGQNLDLNVQQERATLESSAFQIINEPGRGKAGRFELYNRTQASLSDAQFTTCPPQQESWRLDARSMEFDTETGRGQAWNAILRVRDVPIFWLPYFNFPIDSRRKTGLLFPTIGVSSDDGFKLRVPIYVNAAPNFDLLFTPFYMGRRGLKLENETRYLFREHRGTLLVEYLDEDRSLDTNDDSRYLFAVEHRSFWNENWRGNIDYTQVSDSDYFSDMSPQKGSTTDAYVNQSASLGYFQQNWNARLRMQGFEVLGDQFRDPHSMLPQFDYQWFRPSGWLGLDYSLQSELVAFEASEDEDPNAVRLHLEPSISLPLTGPSGSFITEVKLLQTWYKQKKPIDFDPDDPEFEAIANLEENVSRTIPELRIYGSINLERPFEAFDAPWTVTLEPAFQYLLIGRENQSRIFLYDTVPLEFDYDALFRDRRFSSIDRIADANQFTLGISSRILDRLNRQTLRFSLGQIFFLDTSRSDTDDEDIGDITGDVSALAAELMWLPATFWRVDGEYQYNTETSRTEKSSAGLTYQSAENRLFTLKYRMNRDIQNLQNPVLPAENIEQGGFQFSSPLFRDDLQLVGSYFRDFRRNRDTENLIGFQYDSCCWAFRLSWHRRLNTITDPDNEEGRDPYKKGFSATVIIKGLGSDKSATQPILKKSLYSKESSVFLMN